MVEALRSGMFRIKLDNGHETLGYTAGKMRRYRIRILPGDRDPGRAVPLRPDPWTHRLPAPLTARAWSRSAAAPRRLPSLRILRRARARLAARRVRAGRAGRSAPRPSSRRRRAHVRRERAPPPRDWRERGYRWSRRIDHAGIYLLIAGTYTPFALLVLDGDLADRHPRGRLGRRVGGDRAQVRLGGRAEVAGSGDRDRARLGGGGRLPAADRRRRLERHRRSCSPAACSTRPAGSSTRCAGPNPSPARSSATTRSSTCSWSPRSCLQYAVVAFWVVHPV